MISPKTIDKHYEFKADEPITAFVADMSYFSGKLEAYLRYKEISYNRKTVNVSILLNEVYAHTRMMKVPVVKLQDGCWLKDTTPMLRWFDEQKTQFSIYPEDPVTRFLSLMIEDYADEWCWRSALYWRWNFADSKQLLGQRIAREILADWPVPETLAGWYFARRQIKTYLKGDGVTDETEPFVRNHYTDMLASLQQILSDSPYLLGEKPSVADFGFFGPMFRHFGLDPNPAKVMIETAPAVYEWLARLWNARGSRIPEHIEFKDFSHPGWSYFLKEIIDVYLPFLTKNANAWKENRKCFDLVTPDVTYPKLKTVHYRVYCLEKLQQNFDALNTADKQRVSDVFSQYGEFDLGKTINSGLDHEFDLPLQPTEEQLNPLKKLLLTATGTPWDLPAWLKARD